LLPGCKALQYLRTYRSITDPVDEILDDFEIHIGFKKDEAHLTKSTLDILLGHYSLAAEFLENGIQFIGKGVKHENSILSAGLL
jgi:hypothetical protein